MSKAEDKSNKQTSEDELPSTASLGAEAVRPGGQIGPYKLLSMLGEGGFAVVYLAEQQRPVRRQKLGGDHPDKLESLHDFGVMYLDKGSVAARTMGVIASEAKQSLPFHKEIAMACNAGLAMTTPQTASDRAPAPPRGCRDQATGSPYEGRASKPGPEHTMTLKSLNNLIELYEAWNKSEESKKWRANLPRKKDTEDNKKGTTHDK